MNTKIFKVWMSCLAVILITACSDDKKEVYVEEVINNPITGISLSVGDDGIIFSDIGETADVSVTATPSNAGDIARFGYRYASGDIKVFTVDESGKITATGYGESTLNVVATHNASLTASCKVLVVSKLVTSVTIADDYKERSLTSDPYASAFNTRFQNFQLRPQVTVEPADASVSNLKFSSSNHSVASVDGDGLVLAKGVGIATIRVEAIDGSGKFDECIVSVSEYSQAFLDRTNWTATSSPTGTFKPVDTDDVYGGPIEYLIDETTDDTRVGLLKVLAPGGPEDGIIYFTLDLGSEQTFNYFRWAGGWTNGANANNNVKVSRVALYGSNNLSADDPWETLQTNISISGSVYDATITLTGANGTPPPYTYRYVRAVLTPSQASVANDVFGVLWSDFKLGYRKLLEPK